MNEVSALDDDDGGWDGWRRHLRVLMLEVGLNIDRATDRLDHAGELGKNAIAGGVYEAAVVLFD